ncbi:GNAT family N-acetyltransferase [Sphingobacterium paucimobilis]|uniref:N-acetyltransferase domain-containing protein n=1 Tax=Sphingobacterium paucimobilis HER1398 TaxID=1346330 RepID=U2H6S5_9SPHI|nr:GNAT family N-acetyltransferase [Sphingobacterium paucimobilis]ERJ57411.1 hypothetical protein M472_01390 [Sphingobacterium paucimobilis HER1398]
MKKSKIVYSKYTSSDFGSFETLVYNDDVMRYISGSALTTPQARDKFDSILAINDQEELLGYFKVYNSDKEFLGDCKLERCKYDSRKLEIGYILKKSYWGQGYGTQICAAMLALAKKVSPEKDILGIIDPDNIASKKLLEKFGFESYFIGVEDNLPTEKLILKAHSSDR